MNDNPFEIKLLYKDSPDSRLSFYIHKLYLLNYNMNFN